jgi:hypothetical protein
MCAHCVMAGEMRLMASVKIEACIDTWYGPMTGAVHRVIDDGTMRDIHVDMAIEEVTHWETTAYGATYDTCAPGERNALLTVFYA